MKSRTLSTIVSLLAMNIVIPLTTVGPAFAEGAININLPGPSCADQNRSSQALAPVVDDLTCRLRNVETIQGGQDVIRYMAELMESRDPNDANRKLFFNTVKNAIVSVGQILLNVQAGKQDRPATNVEFYSKAFLGVVGTVIPGTDVAQAIVSYAAQSVRDHQEIRSSIFFNSLCTLEAFANITAYKLTEKYVEVLNQMGRGSEEQKKVLQQALKSVVYMYSAMEDKDHSALKDLSYDDMADLSKVSDYFVVAAGNRFKKEVKDYNRNEIATVPQASRWQKIATALSFSYYARPVVSNEVATQDRAQEIRRVVKQATILSFENDKIDQRLLAIRSTPELDLLTKSAIYLKKFNRPLRLAHVEAILQVSEQDAVLSSLRSGEALDLLLGHFSQRRIDLADLAPYIRATVKFSNDNQLVALKSAIDHLAKSGLQISPTEIEAVRGLKSNDAVDSFRMVIKSKMTIPRIELERIIAKVSLYEDPQEVAHLKDRLDRLTKQGKTQLIAADL